MKSCTDAWAFTEYSFLTIFCIEIGLRAAAERHRFFCSGWNVFDFAIVASSLVDVLFRCVLATANLGLEFVSILRIFRLVRLARIMRVLRLLRFMRELLLLAKGIVGALRALTWALVFLFLILYVFAIFLVNLVGRAVDDPVQTERFGTMGSALFTLFQVMTLDDWPEIAEDAMVAVGGTEGTFVGIGISAFVMVTNMCMLNLVTGVILENVMNISKGESDSDARVANAERLRAMKVIWSIFEDCDQDLSGSVTLGEFESALARPEVEQRLGEVDIPHYEAQDLFHLMDVNRNGSVSIEEFIEGCMRVNGEARSKHLVAMQYDVHRIWGSLSEQMENTDIRVDARCKNLYDVIHYGTAIDDDGTAETVQDIAAMRRPKHAKAPVSRESTAASPDGDGEELRAALDELRPVVQEALQGLAARLKAIASGCATAAESVDPSPAVSTSPPPGAAESASDPG